MGSINTRFKEGRKLQSKTPPRWLEDKWINLGTIRRGVVLLAASSTLTFCFDLTINLGTRSDLEFFLGLLGFLIYCSMRFRYKVEKNQLSEKIYEDHKTEILNSRGIEKELNILWHQSTREDIEIFLVFIDIDDLKLFNDRYGHVDGGDWAIVFVAETFKRMLRVGDECGRFGGDEFIIIFRRPANKDAARGIGIAIDRIQAAIENNSREKGKPFTVSAYIHLADTNNAIESEVNIASGKMNITKKEKKAKRNKQ